jgi:hypothetical protein
MHKHHGFTRYMTLLASVLLAALLHASPSSAKDTDSTLAEALFRDARKLLKAGNAPEACPKFEESYRLVPKLGTLLNLATCHAEEGKTGSAWGEFTKAASLAHKAGNTDREQYARKELAALDEKLSKLVIKVPHAVDGIEVEVDGTTLGKAVWSTPVPFDPGQHEILVTAPGKVTWQETTTIPDGPNLMTLNVPALDDAEPGAEPTEPPPTTEPDDSDDGSTQRTIGWIIGAVGVVGVGVGAGFGIDTFMKQGDSDDHCVETACDQDGVDLRDQAQTSATISTVAFAVGLGALTTGVILLLTAGGDDEEEATVGRELQLAPMFGEDGAGLGLRGAW